MAITRSRNGNYLNNILKGVNSMVMYTREELEQLDGRGLLLEYRTVSQEAVIYQSYKENNEHMKNLLEYRRQIGEIILDRMSK